MKKLSLIFLSLWIQTASAQQIYYGLGAQTKGFTHTAGYIRAGVDLSISADMSIFSRKTPSTYSITGGYQLPFRGLVITPALGVGIVRYEDFTDYDLKGKIYQVSETMAVKAIEVAKTGDKGALYIFAKHSDYFYGGLGVKVYF